jgi:hypothetical protein
MFELVDKQLWRSSLLDATADQTKQEKQNNPEYLWHPDKSALNIKQSRP